MDRKGSNGTSNGRASRFSGLLAWLLLSCASALVQAQVYRWKDADGNVHYSDRKPATGQVEEVAVAPPPPPGEARSDATAPAAVGTIAAEPGVAQSNPPDIVMYLSPSCGYCVRAARFFDARGVPWRGLDITASAAARQEFQRAGGRGTPLIFVDGQRVSGFQKDRLDRMLAQRGW